MPTRHNNYPDHHYSKPLCHESLHSFSGRTLYTLIHLYVCRDYRETRWLAASSFSMPSPFQFLETFERPSIHHETLNPERWRVAKERLPQGSVCSQAGLAKLRVLRQVQSLAVQGSKAPGLEQGLRLGASAGVAELRESRQEDGARLSIVTRILLLEGCAPLATALKPRPCASLLCQTPLNKTGLVDTPTGNLH